MTSVPSSELRDRIAAAITADAMKPRVERVGLVNAMLGVVQPELDRLRVELEQARADVERIRTRENGVRTARRQALRELEQARQQAEAAHCRLHYIAARLEHLDVRDDPTGVAGDVGPFLDGPLHPDHLAAYRAAQPTTAEPGCGCQTYVHPGHYPSCPERTTQPST